MKLSEQLRQDHECGDFGIALDGYSERAAKLEAAEGKGRTEKEAMQEQLRQSYEREHELKNKLRQSMGHLNILRSAMIAARDHDGAYGVNAFMQECEVLL